MSIGCNNEKMAHQEIVAKYYDALDTGNFSEIKAIINDSITLVSGDYVTPYSQNGFYEFFKWDSIFKPTYDIVELEEKNDYILVTVAQKNVRNEFLKNNPLVYKVKVSFDSGKISQMEDMDYIDVNWETWSRERDSLISWIKTHHPDLDGFVNDMTMDGATNYLRAIKLYKTGVDKTVYEMWNSFIESNPEFSDEIMPESWYFHNNKEDANRLAQLTINGTKKASSGLYFWYEEAGANLPKIGTKHIVTDFDGKAKAIIEIKKVDTIPFNQISQEYAELDMGTKIQPLEKWRKAHWEFFSATMEESGINPTNEMLVVCERFETIWTQQKE